MKTTRYIVKYYDEEKEPKLYTVEGEITKNQFVTQVRDFSTDYRIRLPLDFGSETVFGAWEKALEENKKILESRRNAVRLLEAKAKQLLDGLISSRVETP